MAGIVYENRFVTEYDDGTEAVRFTDAEWAVMLKDPAFGYVCRAGKHRIDGGTRNWDPAEGCLSCFGEAEAANEAAYYEDFEGMNDDPYDAAKVAGAVPGFTDDVDYARALAFGDTFNAAVDPFALDDAPF